MLIKNLNKHEMDFDNNDNETDYLHFDNSLFIVSLRSYAEISQHS
jgi:hypothetical protein